MYGVEHDVHISGFCLDVMPNRVCAGSGDRELEDGEEVLYF